MIKSTIVLKEKTKNVKRKFGSNPDYYPCIILAPDDKKYMAFFTADQIQTALERAKANPEDIEKIIKA